jgi:sigma-B regulation protein RsbU (phosphoserine phosphatase)
MMMASSSPKTDEVLNKMRDYEELARRFDHLQSAYDELQSRYDKQMQLFNRKCRQGDDTDQALQLANVIIDKSPVILFRRLAGEDPRLVYVSRNIQQFGYTAEEFLARKILFKEIVHADDQERVREEIEAYTEQDVPEYTMTYRVMTRDGEIRWVEDQTSVIWDASGVKTHHQGILVDITERYHAEEQLRKSEEKFRRIVETAGEGFLMMDDELTIIDVNQAYCRMLGYERDEIIGKSPLDLATESFRQFMRAHRERILAMDYRKFEGSLIAKDGRRVPVLIHGNTLRDSQGQKMGNVAFVADLTEQKKALALAGNVQRSLIPRSAPAIDGLDIAGRSDSCDEVGGDYYDYLTVDGADQAAIKVVVGDISGHGVDAALLMTTARAFIRMRAVGPGSPSEIISSMNRDLSTDLGDTGNFMTLFFLEIDPVQKTAKWVRAGHEPALIYNPMQDRFEELLGSGLPLGIDADFAYSEYALQAIDPGTVIALGTDGIWESTDNRGNIFGKERFKAIIRENSDLSADQILANVFKEVKQHSQGQRPEDDITLVIVKTETSVGTP